MARRIQVGEPQNDSEKRVFEYLEQHLPEEYTLFSNVSLSDSGKSLDLDGVILAPHAIYVVEIKEAKGISGDAFKWEIARLSGNVYVPKKHPLNVVEHKTRVLASKLHKHKNLEDIYIQDCICLYSPEKPITSVQDDPDRMKKVFWYRGSETFFTDASALTIPSGERKRYSFDFQNRHEDIRELLRTGFSKPVSPPVGDDFTYDELDWDSTRYRAFFVTSKRSDRAEQSERLLKVYSVPSKNVPLEERKKYIKELERDIQALDEIRDKGDPETGGGNHVIYGLRAFPDEKFWHYSVVMEWVSGRPLSLLLEKDEHLSHRAKYQIAAQLCRGLAFVHTAGVLHRDLRPPNILISTDGEVKITNFDFAKFYGDEKRPTIAIEAIAELEKEHQAQLRYLPPEFAAHRDYHKATIAADIYSLGVVLLELFANRLFPDKLRVEQTDVTMTTAAPVAALLSEMTTDNPEIRQAFSLVQAAKIFEELVDKTEDIGFPEFSLGDIFNSYRIVEHLIPTYLSSVYRAEHTTVDQPAVIKFIKTDSPLKALEEIRKAHDLLHRIDPQYTARWLDGGRIFVDRSGAPVNPEHPEANEIYFQILEFIEGQTLREYIGKAIPETSKALQIALDILDAVSAVHEVGWMHCDIKTENIMITPDEAVKIIDFGLSQKLGEGNPARYGSPGYLPPEVKAGQPWTFAGDLYSTSCVLTSLLVGENSGDSNGPRKDWGLVEQKTGKKIRSLLQKNQSVDPESRSASIEDFFTSFKIAAEQITKAPMETDAYYRLKVDELRQKADNKKRLGPKHRAEQIELAEAADALEAWLEQSRPDGLPDAVMKFVSPLADGLDDEPGAPSLDDNLDAAELQPPASLDEPSADDPTPDEEVHPEIQSETPAQQSLRRELERVRELMEAGEWGQAANLAGHVAGQATEEAGIREQAKNLSAKAEVERDRSLREALDAGDQARARGKDAEARKYYEVALRQDPENNHAREALRAMDAALTNMDTQMRALSRELGVRDDITILGKAVYDGEALAAEDKLSAALLKKLREARQFYDAERTRQGMGTTMARMGDLSARKLAVLQIERDYFLGKKTYFDATIGRDKPIKDVLEEARELLKEHSQDTAQDELKNVANLIETHPVAARTKVEKALHPPKAVAKRNAIADVLNVLRTHKTLPDVVEKRDTLAKELDTLKKSKTTSEKEKEKAELVIELEALLQGIKEFEVRLTERDILTEKLETLKKDKDLSEEEKAEQVTELETLLQGINEIGARSEERLEARFRETEALADPFHEDDRRKLEQKLAEIEGRIAAQEKAEEILVKANEENDPVKSFALILQAQGAFAGIPGLATRVDQAKGRALGILTSRIEERHQEIEDCLRPAATADGNEKYAFYKEARQAQQAAARLPKEWPAEEKPAALIKLEKATEDLMQRIIDTETQARDFDKQAEKVRVLKADPNNYQAALKLLEELKKDKRFFTKGDNGEDEPIYALKELSRELDAIKGVPELMVEAEGALAAKDWRRASELADQVIDLRNAGEFAGRAKEIRAEAEQELAIARAQEHLKDDEVRQADAILANLLATEKNAARKSALESRLQSQLEEIERARADTDQGDPSLGVLFTQAETQAQSPGLDARFQALRVFRYISMDPEEPRQEAEWPEARLSLRTADARLRAQELVESLRGELLEPLQTAHHEMSNPKDSKDELPSLSNLSDEKLFPLAECARQLRSERLLRHERERVLVRWAEVEYKSRRARERQDAGDWKGAAAIWSILTRHHASSELDQNLRQAQIELAVQQAAVSRQQMAYDDAIELLQEAQTQPGLAESWQLDLALAAVYAEQKNFIRAIDMVDLAARRTAKASAADQKTVAVQSAEIRAGRGLHEQGPAEALRVLQEALEQKLTRRHPALLQMQERIFDETAAALLEEAAKASKSGSEQDRIQAVVALLDLRALEEIIKTPEGDRRSTQVLEPMKANLRKVAKSVVDEASIFNPAMMSVAEALTTVTTLLDRLQTFSEVAQLLGSDIGEIPIRLETQQGNLNNIKRRLEALKNLLEESARPELWRGAVQTGIFEPLDTLNKRIQNQQLNEMLVVRNFQKRLIEWKAAHNYLAGEIAAIKYLFRYEENAAGEFQRYEDFARAAEKARDCKARPIHQPKSGQPWEQLHDNDYAVIYEDLGNQLRTTPQYGDGPAGWVAVEKDARARQTELETWETWLGQCGPQIKQAQQAYDDANRQSETLTLGVQLRGWSAALERAQDAADLLSTGPMDDDGAAVPVRSKKASEYDKDRRTNLQNVREWLSDAEYQVTNITQRIETLGKFPTAKEFSDAANQQRGKSADRLETVLECARKIGPSTPAEDRMIQIYEKRLSEMSRFKFLKWGR